MWSEVRCVISSVSFFFLKIVFFVWGLLCSHRNFRIYSSFVKNAIGNLIGISLTLQIALHNMIILTIVILPIREHSVSFHLFVSSSVSFLCFLEFSEYRSFTFVGKFVPRYFMLFHVTVNETVFIILFL